MPRGFYVHPSRSDSDGWYVITRNPGRTLARLGPGISLAQAQSELEGIVRGQQPPAAGPPTAGQHLADRGRPSSRRLSERLRPDSVHAPGSGRIRPADRCRQRREPAVEPRRDASGGDCDADRLGSGPMAAAAAAGHRERDAGADRRRAGCAGRFRGSAAVRCGGAELLSSVRGDRHRRDGAALHAGRLPGHGNPLRIGAGSRRLEIRRAGGAQAGGSGSRRRDALESAPGPGRVRDRSGDGAARRRRA